MRTFVALSYLAFALVLLWHYSAPTSWCWLNAETKAEIWGVIFGALMGDMMFNEPANKKTGGARSRSHSVALPYVSCAPKNLGYGKVWHGIEIVNLPVGTTWHEVISSENDFIRVRVDMGEEHYADFTDETRQALKLTGRVPCDAK